MEEHHGGGEGRHILWYMVDGEEGGRPLHSSLMEGGGGRRHGRSILLPLGSSALCLINIAIACGGWGGGGREMWRNMSWEVLNSTSGGNM